MYFTDFPAY